VLFAEARDSGIATLLPLAGRVVVPDLFVRPAHDGV
jgi:hypothetical protein